MPLTQSYNPVKIRVKRDDGSLGSLDGADLVFADASEASAYIAASLLPDADEWLSVSGEQLTRRAKLVLVPAWVQ